MVEDINIFWNGVKNKENGLLSIDEKINFCEYLIKRIITSPEYSKIYFNTQVYNEINNDVTTRGLHSKGVAIVAKWIAYKAAIDEGKNEGEAEVSGLLAEILGYLHDLGHSPFGHDGEDALDHENKRFSAEQPYKRNRETLYGTKYVEECKDAETEEMSYSHNEISATIGSDMILKYAREMGYSISDEAIQYIKTGILSHSTSKVSKEPDGVEQKAVRVADKIAYVPQDLLDLIKQSVISIDDLSPEEQGLLGLNEKQLTKKEKKYIKCILESNEKISQKEQKRLIGILDNYKLSDKDMSDLKNACEIASLSREGANVSGNCFINFMENKTKLKDKLRQINNLSEADKIVLFKNLDARVGEIQVEIGEKCVHKCLNGEIRIDNQKSVIDFFRNYVNKNKIDGNHEITTQELYGFTVFSKLRNAQKGRRKARKDESGNIIYEPIPKEEQKKEIDATSKEFTDFLITEYQMDPMLAALWVTKSKRQDAFINGELTRIVKEKDGTEKEETLSDINQRNDKKWMMKTTFQFFYTYLNLIPKEFRNKHKDSYTNEQLVSSFIASFTNTGLEELYKSLVDKKLIVSRDDVIKQLREKETGIEKETGLKTLYDCINAINNKYFEKSKNANSKASIPVNDLLEFFYEEYVGEKIVKGKNSKGRDKIPPVRKRITIISYLDNVTDKKFLSLKRKPKLLSSAINLSTQEIVFNDIETVIASVIAIQDDKIKEKSEQLGKELEEKND